MRVDEGFEWLSDVELVALQILFSKVQGRVDGHVLGEISRRYQSGELIDSEEI